MRRSFLAASAAALTSFLLPRQPQAGGFRRIALRHAASGARFEGPWHDGRLPDPGAMAELSAVLADPGATPPLAFDPATIDIVWQVAMQAGLEGPLEIRSGYRTPSINRRAHGAGDSLHLRASAVDLSIPAWRMPTATDVALKLGRGGVGVYRRRNFLHLDSGAVRHWTDGIGNGADPQAQRVARIAAEWRGTLRVERY